MPLKRIVITGGQGDLGSEIAAVFREAGWDVDAPGSAVLDVTDRSAVASYLGAARVDLLVCCAGMTSDGPLARLPESEWDRTIGVNFQGAAAAAAAVIPGMEARGSGHIIFISSHSAIHPPAGQAAYAAAKAALLGLTTSLATSYGSSNIRVNAILPGFLETRMTGGVSPTRKEAVLGEHSLGRFNTPGAVAGFIHFLQEHLPHTSGQVFRLDSRVG